MPLVPRSAIVAVLIGLSLAGPQATASDALDACPAQLPAGAVRIATRHATPHLSYEHSAREIGRRLDAPGDGVTLGMTQTSSAVSVDIIVHRTVSSKGGRVCARPEIGIELAHTSVEILLASEIQGEPCVADAVLNHEMVHVAIEHETLDWAGRSLEAQMRDYYRERVFDGDETTLRTQLAQEFEQRWSPALEALLGMAKLKHAEHDERDRYADREICGGALLRIARRIE